MPEEVSKRLYQILLTLLDLAGSKKFLVALAGGFTTYQATGDPRAILWAAIAYIVAQGAEDFGKAGIKVEQQKPDKNIIDLVYQAVSEVVNKQISVPASQPRRESQPAGDRRSLGPMFPKDIANALLDAGFTTAQDVKDLTEDELFDALAPKGITYLQVKKIVETVNI